MPSATRSSSASRGSSPIRSARRTSSRSSAAATRRDLHARFGGDEFCFLIPDLPGCAEAADIAERFKDAVEGHDWSRDDRRLAANPVSVDVGVVCLHLGPVAERRGVARKLAADLIHRADTLMYDAKSQQSDARAPTAVKVEDGALVDIPDAVERPPSGGRGSAPILDRPLKVARSLRRSARLGVRAARLPSRSRVTSRIPYGGCSSVAERRTVAPEVAGSNPVIHPNTSNRQ